MDPASWSRQLEFDRRLEWGPTGTEIVDASCIAVVVDVLRFTTAVDIGTQRGAAIYPCRWNDPRAAEFARSLGARFGDGHDPKGPSLSPAWFETLGPDDRVVLPSLNGSTCAVIAHEAGAAVVAGCLRNASAIGAALRHSGRPILVVASGERWPDGSLRPALEDLVGAGAILSQLGGRPSPEARAAIAAWRDAEGDLRSLLISCGSAKELIGKGQIDDVELAAQVDFSDAVPMMRDGAFRSGGSAFSIGD